jgi:hypothetical protein
MKSSGKTHSESSTSNMDAIDGLKPGLTELADALQARQVPYALIGGLAVSYRGLTRATEDIDLLLSVPQLSLPALLEDLRERGFEFDLLSVIREWNTYGMTVLSYRDRRVDWLKPMLPCVQRVLDTATVEDLLDVPVRVATVEGLIVLKTLAMRPQDQLDISRLLAAHRGTLDIAAVLASLTEALPADDSRMTGLEALIQQHYDESPNGS